MAVLAFERLVLAVEREARAAVVIEPARRLPATFTVAADTLTNRSEFFDLMRAELVNVFVTAQAL